MSTPARKPTESAMERLGMIQRHSTPTKPKTKTKTKPSGGGTLKRKNKKLQSSLQSDDKKKKPKKKVKIPKKDKGKGKMKKGGGPGPASVESLKYKLINEFNNLVNVYPILFHHGTNGYRRVAGWTDAMAVKALNYKNSTRFEVGGYPILDPLDDYIALLNDAILNGFFEMAQLLIHTIVDKEYIPIFYRGEFAGVVSLIHNNTYLLDYDTVRKVQDEIDELVLARRSNNIAFGSSIIMKRTQNKLVFKNQSEKKFIAAAGIMGNALITGGFIGDEKMGTDQYRSIAQQALRGQLANRISDYMTSQRGTKGLIAMSRAANNADGGYLGLAPNGTTNKLYDQYQIDPTILQMAGGDQFVNNYIAALNRIGNRKLDGDGGENSSAHTFTYTPLTQRLSMDSTQFNTLIQRGEVVVKDLYKGVYKVPTKNKYTSMGDIIVLDRMRSNDVTFQFKNVTSDQDEVTKERFELDMPLAPSIKSKRSKRYKRKKAKKRARKKSGGK